jgi:hypothetical protein
MANDDPGGAPPPGPHSPGQWGTPQPGMPGQPSGYTPPQGYAPDAYPYSPPPPAYYQGPPMYPVPQQGNGIGIAGGVCGIVAVVLCWIPFVDYISIILGALAIIFGALGVRHANTHGGAGKGMAITGIVTGIVALVIAVLFLAVVFTAVNSINANFG